MHSFELNSDSVLMQAAVLCISQITLSRLLPTKNGRNGLDLAFHRTPQTLIQSGSTQARLALMSE